MTDNKPTLWDRIDEFEALDLDINWVQETKTNWRPCRNKPTTRPQDHGIWFDLVSYGDYHGGTVERANLEGLASLIPDSEVLHEDYGSKTLVFPVTRIKGEQVDHLLEALESLSTYPLLDDGALGEIETEIEDEAWGDWVYGDLVRLLERRFSCDLDTDALDHDVLHDMFRSACNALNEYPVHETGCIVSWNLDHISQWDEWTEALEPYFIKE